MNYVVCQIKVNTLLRDHLRTQRHLKTSMNGPMRFSQGMTNRFQLPFLNDGS